MLLKIKGKAYSLILHYMFIPKLKMQNGSSFVYILYILFCVFVDKGLTQFNVDLPDDWFLEDDEQPLRCFFCHSMGPSHDCENFSAYKAAMDAANRGRYHGGPVTLKTCSPPFDKSCIIETFTDKSGELVQIRDCSDDKTFDFTEIMTNRSSYDRLLSLHDNNETACSYDGQNTVCLSKCGRSENYTDFCNGPQFDSASSGSYSKCILLTAVFLYVLLFP